MKIEATKEQIKQMAANAVNASQPMGMGFLHYDSSRQFMSEDFECEDGLYLDYVQGRMVKLRIKRVGQKTWEFRDEVPNPEYQSWCRTYPSYQDLVDSVLEK